jgi:hypothetical protein
MRLTCPYVHTHQYSKHTGPISLEYVKIRPQNQGAQGVKTILGIVEFAIFRRAGFAKNGHKWLLHKGLGNPIAVFWLSRRVGSFVSRC